MMGTIPNLWLAILGLITGGGAVVLGLLYRFFGESGESDDGKEEDGDDLD